MQIISQTFCCHFQNYHSTSGIQEAEEKEEEEDCSPEKLT
jgi:hypothetical protein